MDVNIEIVNWLVRFDYGMQNLTVYLEDLSDEIEDEKLFEMAKKELEKYGWKLPEKQMLSWETEIW